MNIRRWSIALACAAPLLAQNTAPELAFEANANLKLPGTSAGRAAGWPPTPRATFSSTRGRASSPAWAPRALSRRRRAPLRIRPRRQVRPRSAKGVCGFLFAQAVRVDPQDNIWVVDRGSNMVIKFNPEGRVVLPEPQPSRPVLQAEDAARRKPPGPAFPATASTVRPMWPGTQPETSSSPTVTATRVSPSSIKTAGFSNPGGSKAPNPASSTRRTRSPPMRRARSTWPISATSAFRSSTTRASSRHRFPMSARPGPFAFPRH